MNDASGQNWIQHTLLGISKGLESCGSQVLCSNKLRHFYLDVRVYEIHRALIFSKPTYLARAEWRRLSREMWLGSRANEWHPNETLLDLMVLISDLAHRWV